jgi:hypothetical protein
VASEPRATGVLVSNGVYSTNNEDIVNSSTKQLMY